MGDIWLPDTDKAISRYVVSFVQDPSSFKILEEEWIKHKILQDAYSLLSISTAVCIIMLGYLAGMRDKEIARAIKTVFERIDGVCKVPTHIIDAVRKI